MLWWLGCRLGLVLMHEKRTEWEYHISPDGSECWNPAWVDQRTLVFGPNPHPRLDKTNGLLLPKSGLRVSTLSKNGFRCLSHCRLTATPRECGRRTLLSCQFGDQFLAFRLPDGKEEPLGRGFDMVPEPGGSGMAWMDRPPITTDYWTGVPAPGTRIIRWRADELSEIPGVVQAEWGREGHLPGLYGTQISQAPVAGQAWTSASQVLARSPVLMPLGRPLSLALGICFTSL